MAKEHEVDFSTTLDGGARTLVAVPAGETVHRWGVRTSLMVRQPFTFSTIVTTGNYFL